MNFYCLGGLFSPVAEGGGGWTYPLCSSYPNSLGPLAQGCDLDLECHQQTEPG